MEDQEFQKRTGKVMIILGWLVLLGLLTAYFSDFLSKQNNPNQDLALTQTSDFREIRLQRNRYGHYVASGEINRHPVTFMLDTGATHISIPENVARKLGLKQGFPMTVATANGDIEVFATVLDQVSLGGIELQNISAGINPYMQGDEVLLGMSFLKHLNFSQENDQLLIRQY